MGVKVLRYAPDDNIVTVMAPCKKGSSLELDGNSLDIIVNEDIPVGHKVACKEIKKGDYIYKCGHSVGSANADIHVGDYVHTHNLEDTLTRVALDEDYIVDTSSVREIEHTVDVGELPKLYGYKRSNGMVGFRNHLLVISSVICANQPLTRLRGEMPDVVFVENPTGCIILPNEVDRMKSTILGLARNPNVGAVIYVGLGCELVSAGWFYEQTKDEKPSAFFVMQEDGSSEATYNNLKSKIEEFKAVLDNQEREEVDYSAIIYGTKCGGSDWTTTAVSNPTIGLVSDVIVKNGGTSYLGETNGLTGGQDLVLARARTQQVSDQIMGLMRAIYKRSLAVGHRLEEGNPSPGNKAGGITTLKEKALGNVLKSGSAPVEGILHIGEYPTGKGLYVADNPGLDPLSLIGLTCCGANVLVYSTGRGSPVGTPLAPSIKLTGSRQAMDTFAAHMDVDLTKVISGEMTIEDGAKLLFDEVIAVCNGKLTKSEIYGHQEYSFPMVMGVL